MITKKIKSEFWKTDPKGIASALKVSQVVKMNGGISW